MLIYHGSNTAVLKPEILPANRLLDFGEGFYTTSSFEQAKRWAARVSERKNTTEQIVSVFKFDITEAERKLKIKSFNSPASEWLDFIAKCRNDINYDHGYDIVMGPVANDNVYATIQLYETGLLSEEETIVRLKIEKIYDQILFHTIQALQYCTYLKHENIQGGTIG